MKWRMNSLLCLLPILTVAGAGLMRGEEGEERDCLQLQDPTPSPAAQIRCHNFLIRLQANNQEKRNYDMIRFGRKRRAGGWNFSRFGRGGDKDGNEDYIRFKKGAYDYIRFGKRNDYIRFRK